ncbi:hypothetical protein E1287_30590 [Actinomadura sp. KC06]|uniref:hypothetical protein n=1 Tax=Actinomadura sp. KC06 TaxID=2530369 RepID=UPI001043780B|nr:hypothetical protein [Actinomadura sp. KC06]TDD29631.1 hypothetical protein E1287_30590 [Actinomadura sp. KC06]
MTLYISAAKLTHQKEGDVVNVTVTVEVFHNVSKDAAGRPLGFDGYQQGHPVVKVFEFSMEANEGTEPVRFAETAFQIGNELHELSTDYYRRRLRSLSVGDLVKIGLLWLSCEPVGWQPITDHTPNDITATHQGEHGTQPWRS